MEKYSVRLIDVSTWQDDYDTPRKPDFVKTKEAGFMGVIVRVGYGLVEDRMFRWFWSKAKGVLERGAYWYLDYYSNKGTGLSNEAWGKEQAGVCYDLLKGDPGEIPLFVDCENYGGAWNVNFLTLKPYNEILAAFLKEWKLLSGTEACIYCSPGFFDNLWNSVKKMRLWVAWYTRVPTTGRVKEYCRQKGWLGEILMWQYASDGDIDDDGSPDGKKLGFETSALDLNAWLGTVESWSKFCGGTTPVVIPTPEDEEPPQPIETGSTKVVSVKRVIGSSGLNVRKTHSISAPFLDWVGKGTSLYLLETKVLPGEIWHRVGINQWCAELYNGIRLME